MSDIRNSIEEYCAKIGADPLLVQGAGGNFSWKDGDTLWIKASGMWLADAKKQDIFVPVDLENLVQAIHDKKFDVIPKPIGASKLRPSIETMLHALMPQKIVAHLHDIEILSYLVRNDFDAVVEKLMLGFDSWIVVDYFKPGAELAAAVKTGLEKNPTAQIIFLKNHGVVFGAENLSELCSLLGKIHSIYTTDVTLLDKNRDLQNSLEINGYEALTDNHFADLVYNDEIFYRLEKDWALYPDHVVFLGHAITTFESADHFKKKSDSDIKTELVFIKNFGIYAKSPFSKAKSEQLLCYKNIIVRQKPEIKLVSLSAGQISELLNWDAETYRKEMAK